MLNEYLAKLETERVPEDGVSSRRSNGMRIADISGVSDNENEDCGGDYDSNNLKEHLKASCEDLHEESKSNVILQTMQQAK